MIYGRTGKYRLWDESGEIAVLGRRSRRHQLRMRDCWRKRPGCMGIGAAHTLHVCAHNWIAAYQLKVGS